MLELSLRYMPRCTIAAILILDKTTYRPRSTILIFLRNHLPTKLDVARMLSIVTTRISNNVTQMPMLLIQAPLIKTNRFYFVWLCTRQTATTWMSKLPSKYNTFVTVQNGTDVELHACRLHLGWKKVSINHQYIIDH